MTAKALLQTLRAGGATVQVTADGRLAVRARPGVVSKELQDLLREHRDDIIDLLGPVAGPEPVDDWERWREALAQVTEADLPAVPWAIEAHRKVINNARFLTSLRADVALGPRSPRARFGALQADVRAVLAIVARGRDSRSSTERTKEATA